MAFTTPSDESQQFLDIGCGTGDFTREWILPSCEPCKRIVAVDYSASMLEYAKEKYAHEKILYEHLDIDGDVTGFLTKYGTFQRVYSFKTLHWSRDLHRSLGNIAKLLAPGGECLLCFSARSFLFESFKEMSRLQSWSKYADVLLQAVTKSHDIVDQKGQREYLSSALSSAGLVPYTSEVLIRTLPAGAIQSPTATDPSVSQPSKEMASLNTEEKKLQAGPFKSVLAPEIYEEGNANFNDQSRGIIQIFKMAFTTPSDESQQFLDIGCGTGDFTKEWILPSCEPCKRIVAVDFSASMLEFAKEKYAHEKIVYEQLDIDGDVTGFLRKYGTFQRVYSFKTLHWSRDLNRSLGNIAQLLAPGGECLLFFQARGLLCESFKEMSRLQPWSKYADVLLQAVPKSHDIVDLKGQRDYISSALSSAGLVPYTAEVITRTFTAAITAGPLQKLARIANPLFSLLSEEEKTAFLETLSTHLPEWHDSYCKRGGQIPWSSFLVHARKP
ncbi:hypothetical protein MTO96_016056 [Rhipicephalus appendiculatus]